MVAKRVSEPSDLGRKTISQAEIETTRQNLEKMVASMDRSFLQNRVSDYLRKEIPSLLISKEFVASEVEAVCWALARHRLNQDDPDYTVDHFRQTMADLAISFDDANQAVAILFPGIKPFDG